MMLLDGGGRLVQHLLVEDVVADRLPSRVARGLVLSDFLLQESGLT